MDKVVRDELEEFLLADDSRLGAVCRHLRDGLSPAEIGQVLGTTTFTYVYNYTWIRDCILDGRIPASPTPAAQIAGRLRSIVKDHQGALSDAAINVLRERLLALQAVVDDSAAVEAEDADLAKETVRGEKEGMPGVYVYGLPHYLRYPSDPETGRTLLKVGRSKVDAEKRARGQRNTALPEDPALLRVYECRPEEAALFEHRFHRLLEAAGHAKPASRTGGTEFFLTTVRFLDEIARQLGLELHSYGADLDYFD